MAGLTALIQSAFEDMRNGSIDIFGSTSTLHRDGGVSEAINDQLGAIAEQESSFQVLDSRRENTEVTDVVKDVILEEKERLANVEYK